MQATRDDADVSVQVRPIGHRELDEVTTVHVDAFPGSALTVLGGQAVRRYYEWQLAGPHDVVPLGAYAAGRMAGFCFGGTFRGAMTGYLRKNRTYLALHVLSHPALLRDQTIRTPIATAARLLGPSRPTAPVVDTGGGGRHLRTFAILSIAVAPAFQRRGIGELLLAEEEAVATREGYDQMHLTVNELNTNAISFYENRGWRRFGSRERWDGEMIKPLRGGSS